MVLPLAEFRKMLLALSRGRGCRPRADALASCARDGRVLLEVHHRGDDPSRTTADLLAGTWLLLATQLGAVPRRLIWDNESGIGRRNHLAAGVGEFCGGLATRIHQLKAYDPESKGGVERINQYFETSFLPGRDFTGPADFNAQMGDWLPKANTRTVAELAEKVRKINVDDDDTIGAPRATAELNDGIRAGKRVKRVARVMRVHGIRGYQKRRRVRTTIPSRRGRRFPISKAGASPPRRRTGVTSATSPTSLTG